MENGLGWEEWWGGAEAVSVVQVVMYDGSWIWVVSVKGDEEGTQET